MANVLIVKNPEGKLQGFGERGERAYNRFLSDVRALEPGELLAFSYKVPRSGPFHGRHFRMLGFVYDAQDRFTDELHFRKWGEVGAGHCELLPDGSGQLVAVPKSIDYESLDQVEFEPIHRDVKCFFRSEHARRHLWPWLTDQLTYETMEILLQEFD